LHLQAHLFAEKEDDTKSLMSLVSIYQTLLVYSGVAKEEFDGRWKSFMVRLNFLLATVILSSPVPKVLIFRFSP
jgi:hypothetical protein